MEKQHRRKFLATLGIGSASIGLGGLPLQGAGKDTLKMTGTSRFRISLNAYSFNAPLTAKKTTLEELIGFCSETGFEAIDMTGYYFPGYPAVPPDEYIYHLKNKAHRSGIAISGTGVRNDFALPDASSRKGEIQLVKNWIEVAAKLGAPVIRIFTGRSLPAGHTWDETEKWIIEDVKTCVAYGEARGVIVALQNHNDFIKTAAQAMDIIEKVNSPWFGLVLDTGSFVTEEPYGEIQKTAKYAVNWQIKEKLNYMGTTSDMDLDRLMQIIVASPYRGYLPIETLSPGDPFSIVPPFLRKVKAALQRAESMQKA